MSSQDRCIRMETHSAAVDGPTRLCLFCYITVYNETCENQDTEEQLLNMGTRHINRMVATLVHMGLPNPEDMDSSCLNRCIVSPEKQQSSILAFQAAVAAHFEHDVRPERIP